MQSRLKSDCFYNFTEFGIRIDKFLSQIRVFTGEIMNFHDIRMPKFIETFAVGRPEFATSCAMTLSGREVRNLDREYAKQKYLIKNCRLSSLEFEQFSSFFRARRGGNFAFRFRDNVDYQVSRQIIGKGDGELTQFQLVKLYEDPIWSYARTISKPLVVENSMLMISIQKFKLIIILE